MEKSNIKESIQKDHKRALPKFLLGLGGSLLLGFAIGFAVALLDVRGLAEQVSGGLRGGVRAVAPYAIVVSAVFLLGGAWQQYRAARRLCAAWDGESEEVADAADERLNWALLLTTAQMLLSLFFFSAHTLLYDGKEPWPAVLNVGAFVISFGVVVVLQQKTVDLARQFNPEKKGSVYDVKFHKKWLESCDEAEQKQIGQAAYKAFAALNTACPMIWLALVILSFLLDIGLLPSFTVILVWGILQGSYILECMRLQKRKR